MSKNLLVPLAVSLLFLGSVHSQESGNAYGQENAVGHVCADLPGQTSGTRRFLRVGETLQISLRGDVGNADKVEGGAPASVAACEPLALDLHWSNGRNNGSNFNLTFFDNNKKPIYTKSFSAFLAGNLEFDLSSSDFRRVYASSMMVTSVPASVTIQAVSPFASPVGLSFVITRVARKTGAGSSGRMQEDASGGSGVTTEVAGGSAGSPRGQPARGAGRQGDTSEGNEVVSIRNVVRLIGASKLPVVQIELKTAHPFPINEAPLQLQIGKKVFVDELSGEYTGRSLTLSLTPEMFAELQDGDEIVASFGKREGNATTEQRVWYFGKLKKGE
jgi:hypothetical protein